MTDSKLPNFGSVFFLEQLTKSEFTYLQLVQQHLNNILQIVKNNKKIFENSNKLVNF